MIIDGNFWPVLYRRRLEHLGFWSFLYETCVLLSPGYSGFLPKPNNMHVRLICDSLIGCRCEVLKAMYGWNWLAVQSALNGQVREERERLSGSNLKIAAVLEAVQHWQESSLHFSHHFSPISSEGNASDWWPKGSWFNSSRRHKCQETHLVQDSAKSNMWSYLLWCPFVKREQLLNRQIFSTRTADIFLTVYWKCLSFVLMSTSP